MRSVNQSPEKTPHPASVARFARRGPRWANRRYGATGVVVYALAIGSLAIDLAETHRGGLIRWIVFVVFAVLTGVVELLNARALRRTRSDR